jgi:hypothetical protein
LGQKIKKRKEKMRLTEVKLKQLINEEYENALMESSIPEFDVKSLIPKAKEMSKTTGKEDLMQEGAGLMIVGLTLAGPKILEWCAKAAKAIVKTKTVSNYLEKKTGSMLKQITIEQAANATVETAHSWHKLYLMAINKTVVAGIAFLTKVFTRGKVQMDEEQREKASEAIFMVLLAFVAIATGKAMLAKGIKGMGVFQFSIEGLTTAVKAFEGTEYAGLVPAALAFLKSHDEEH